MKINYFIISILIISSLFTGCAKNDNSKSVDPSLFTNPPQASKVHTYWKWMDGNITKEGISKDLEAMSRQGIVQATILNVGLFDDKDFGITKVNFNTPEWYEMFKWTLTEAERCKIKIGFHSCDGWSSSGGPWIKPENSMKQFTWNKQYVKGGSKLKLNLSSGFSLHDFYEDVAVIAYKAKKEANSFITASPKIIFNDSSEINYLYDGNPMSSIDMRIGNSFNIIFENDFLVDKIAIHPRKHFMWGNIDSVWGDFSIWYEDKTDQLIKLKNFKIYGLNETIIVDIPTTKASTFKLQLEGLSNTNSWLPYLIGEVEFLRKNDSPSYLPGITNHQAKTVSVKGYSPNEYDYSSKENDTGIPSENIIDLSSKFNEKEELIWDVPEGNWTIIRFGYTTTGAANGPATKYGKGLECDKMDAKAVDFHFKSFPQKLIDHAGKHVGNTFESLLVDSWECGFQNWTASFPEAFKELNGYSINQWIPVLCGEVVENTVHSEAFLHDFRSTISHLIENNYYKHYSDLCHQSGLEFHSEVIYGGGGYPPLDIMKANSYVDVPMFEFWTGSSIKKQLIEYRPSKRSKGSFPSNAALFYNKKIAGVEAYTGYANYSESLREIKVYGDRSFCSGVNQMKLHSYVHQPKETKPGFTLQNWGLPFNRHNPYWDYASAWIDYLARSQYVLQNSNEVSDILIYTGDRLPQFDVLPEFEEIPKGYKMNVCNYDILKNKLDVKDGKIITENGLSFSMLVLPTQKGMNFSTLQCLDKLIKKGAVVFGEKPQQMLSKYDINNNQKQFDLLTKKIWGEDTLNGKVICGMTIDKALENIELSHDFIDVSNDSSNFLFAHSQASGVDFYYVVNQLNKAVNAQCQFRISGKKAQVWNPVDGSILQIQNIVDQNNSTSISYNFKPHETVFFVFTNETNAEIPILQTEINTKQDIKDFEGQIEFFPAYDQKIDVVQITDLKPLSQFENEDIKYFAGKAKYTLEFQSPEDVSKFIKDTYLSLGLIESNAEVVLNGKTLGYVWLPNQKFNVSKTLQNTNTLEITVAIPYRNRFIGDFKIYGEPKNIWTTADIKKFLGYEVPLKPVGLMGPIEIFNYK